MNIRENAVHTFNFVLQNAQRKYDGRLLPMGRISIQLKRLTWMQNFTGYLNDSPIFQAWPGTLSLTASCTLKRPQFWPWDPTTIDAISMITSVLASANGPGNVKGDGAGDHNLSRLIIKSLSEVVGWDPKKIHIGQVPNDWFKFAQQVGDLIEADTSMSAYLGGLSTIGGAYTGAQINIPAGRYAGIPVNDIQARWLSAIYNAIRGQLHGSDDDVLAAFMCVWQESRAQMYANANNPQSLLLPHDRVGSDHSSVGLFQQQVGGAQNSTANWGTTAELMNVVTSTTKFFQKLQTVKGARFNDTLTPGGRQSGTSAMSLNDQVQAVQGSTVPNAYGQWQPLAVALLTIANGLSQRSTGTSTNGVGGHGNISSTTTASTGTGSQLAYTAKKLITDHSTPGTYIRYQEGGDDPVNDPSPAVLDCSSLVDWVYYNATGGHRLASGRSTSQSIYTQSVIIPLDVALRVQGSVLFPSGSAPGHIGISLGDGVNHVAAHTQGVPIDKQVDVSSVAGNGFTQGGLLPGINYSGSATDSVTATKLASTLKSATTVAPGLTTIGGTASRAMESLIGFQQIGSLNVVGLGNILPPRRALMNDQPFLPWLANLVNASMRSFCSAPNGDFIAWFPDYFGVWGTAAVMNIQLIELQNFVVLFSDQQMVTHEFVIGSPSGGSTFDPTSAGISIADPSGSFSQSMLFLQTSGIATMDFPEIFKAIYGRSAPPGWTEAFLARFGARPNVDMVPNIPSGRAEFFMALYNFMRYWAQMFTATVPLTFMPELWPGMLLRIPEIGFQAYVRGVTHSGSFGEGGGFRTDVDICAPSNIAGPNRMDLLSLLPQGK